MTEHPNATAFRRAFTDMMQGDLDTFRGLLAPDVLWYKAGNPHPVRGRDAVMEIFASLVTSELEFDDQLEDVLANDTRLIALIRARISSDDTEIAYTVAEIAYLDEGKITERRAFMDAIPEDVSAFFTD